MEDGVWNISARILPHRFAEPPPGGGQMRGVAAPLPRPEASHQLKDSSIVPPQRPGSLSEGAGAGGD